LGALNFQIQRILSLRRKVFNFENSFKTYNPAFDFRRALFPGQKNESYRWWYKLEDLDDWGMFVHTFHRLLPPEKYYEKKS